ncbi:MAG TPA: hypothetical protein VNC22_22910 [Sporichthya sp.]|jgi:hypothetical protein|nr:hypothetical protein [Sporichthya sp.]
MTLDRVLFATGVIILIDVYVVARFLVRPLDQMTRRQRRSHE